MRVRYCVLKNTLGKRCVVLYEFQDGPAGLQSMVGKLYRADRGAAIFDLMLDLWILRGLEGEPGARFGMPEPLAYVPELGMLLQTVVKGRSLASWASRGDWPSALRGTAENLARLHRLPSHATPRGVEEHLRRLCRPGPEAIGREIPELQATVAGIVARVVEGAARAGACTVHGDLSLQQVFVDSADISFIDFDGACASSPALDLANFIVSLEGHVGRASAPLEEIFLSQYRRWGRPVSQEALAPWRSFAYLRRAMIATRRREIGWVSRVRRLVEFADRSNPAVGA